MNKVLQWIKRGIMNKVFWKVIITIVSSLTLYICVSSILKKPDDTFKEYLYIVGIFITPVVIIFTLLKKQWIEFICKALGKSILSFRVMITLFVFIIMGLVLHFVEWNMFTGNDVANGTNHSIGDTAIMTFIGTLLGLLTVIGFVETIKGLKSEKIDNYSTFYKACADLFKETKKGDYLIFSGGTLVPGALFVKFNKHTKVGKDGDSESHEYYTELKKLIERLESTDPKCLRFILQIVSKESINAFRCGRDDINSYNKTDNMYENYKNLFDYKGTAHYGKMNTGFVNYGDDCIDYYIISNGKKVVFAKTLNDFKADSGTMVGLSSDNQILIDILEANFEKKWENLKEDNLIIEQDDKIKAIIENGIIGCDGLQENLEKRLGKKMKENIDLLKIKIEKELIFYEEFIKNMKIKDEEGLTDEEFKNVKLDFYGRCIKDLEMKEDDKLKLLGRYIKEIGTKKERLSFLREIMTEVKKQS